MIWYSLGGDRERTFHPKVSAPICANISGEDDCFVVEIEFKDIEEALKDENHLLRRYVDERVLRAYWRFFTYVSEATPDHVVPSDRIFVVADASWDREDTFVYILFRHYEHCAATSILKVLIELQSLCESTGCDARLYEMSCPAEYVLFELVYPTLNRWINKAFYGKQNPWRRLLRALMQDHFVEYVNAVIGAEKQRKPQRV